MDCTLQLCKLYSSTHFIYYKTLSGMIYKLKSKNSDLYFRSTDMCFGFFKKKPREVPINYYNSNTLLPGNIIMS